MSNDTIVHLLLGALVSVIGWLLKRNWAIVDKRMDRMENKVDDVLLHLAGRHRTRRGEAAQ